MIIVNELLLDEFRAAWRCELCGKRTPSGADPCHVWARGMGGGSRLDIRFNLLSGCRRCHSDSHNGKIPRERLIAVVARREKVRPEDVVAIIERHLRTEQMKVHLLPVDKIEVDGRHRKKASSGVDSLARSIEKVGLLQPIGVSPEMKIVYGERRLRAVQKLGWKDIPAVVTDSDAFSCEHDENVERVDLTNEEKLALASKISEGLRKAGMSQREADGAAGKRVGLGGRETVRKARVAMEADPDALAKHATVNKASKATTPQRQFAVDGCGEAVPPELRELFADDFYQRATRALYAVKKEWVDKSMQNPWLLSSAGKTIFQDVIDAMLDALDSAVPYCVCPECKSKGCGECRRVGYMPLWRAREVARAHRE